MVPGLDGYDNNNIGELVMSRLQQQQQHQTTSYQTTRMEKAAIIAASAAATVASNCRRSSILECTPTGQAPASKQQYQNTKKAVSLQ